MVSLVVHATGFAEGSSISFFLVHGSKFLFLVGDWSREWRNDSGWSTKASKGLWGIHQICWMCPTVWCRKDPSGNWWPTRCSWLFHPCTFDSRNVHTGPAPHCWSRSWYRVCGLFRNHCRCHSVGPLFASDHSEFCISHQVFSGRLGHFDSPGHLHSRTLDYCGCHLQKPHWWAMLSAEAFHKVCSHACCCPRTLYPCDLVARHLPPVDLAVDVRHWFTLHGPRCRAGDTRNCWAAAFWPVFIAAGFCQRLQSISVLLFQGPTLLLQSEAIDHTILVGFRFLWWVILWTLFGRSWILPLSYKLYVNRGITPLCCFWMPWLLCENIAPCQAPKFDQKPDGGFLKWGYL